MTKSTSDSSRSFAAKAKNKKHNCDPMIRIYEKLVKIRDREKEKEVDKHKEGELNKLIKPLVQEKSMIPEMEKDAAQGQILVNLMYVKNKIRQKWNVLQARQETEDLPSYSEMKKELEVDTQTRVRELWYDFVGTKVQDKSITRDWKRIIGEPLSDSDIDNADADEGADLPEFSTEKSLQSRKPKPPIVPAPFYHSYKYVPYTGPSRKQIVDANAAKKKLMDVKFQDALKRDPRKSCIYDAAIKVIQKKNTFEFNKTKSTTSGQNLTMPTFPKVSSLEVKQVAPTSIKERASVHAVKQVSSSHIAKDKVSSHAIKQVTSLHVVKDKVSSHAIKQVNSKENASQAVKDLPSPSTKGTATTVHKTSSATTTRDAESTYKGHTVDSPKPERSKRPDTKIGSSFSSESTAFEELLLSDGSDSTEKSAAPQSSSEGGEIPTDGPLPPGKKSYKSPATSTTTTDSEIDDSLSSWNFSEMGEGEFEHEEEGTLEKVAVYIDPVSDTTELYSYSEFGEMGSDVVHQYVQHQEPVGKATDSFQSSICSFHDPLCPKKSVDSEDTDVCDPYVAYKIRRQAKLDKQKKDEEFRLKLLERLQAVPSDEETSDEEIGSVESEKMDELEEEVKLEKEVAVSEPEPATDEELEEEEMDLEGEFVEGEILAEEIVEEFEAEEIIEEEEAEEVKEVKEEEKEESEEKDEKEKERKKKKVRVHANKDLGNLSDLGSSSSSEESELSAKRKYIPPPVPVEEVIDIYAKSRLFNCKYPELYASDTSIYPSYTNLKLPYSLICADRNKTRIAQYKKLFRNEIRSLERRHPFAFGGVQLARQFIIGIRVPRQFKDPFTVKERERIEFLLKNTLT